MKKHRALKTYIALLLSLSLCCGCQDNGKSNDKLLDKNNPVTVTIWHYYNGVQHNNFDEMVKEFNNTVGHEKGIIVEAYTKNSISELTDSILSSVNNDAGAEELPDIFTAYAETAYVVDKAGKLADIKQHFTQEEIDEYVDEYINEGNLTGDGSLKIFPTAKSTEVMMLNATDWEKFASAESVTVDDLKTWEGLAEVSEKYYNYTDALTPDIENDGKAFFGRDSVANYMNIGAKQLGAEFASRDKNNNMVYKVDKETVRRLWDNHYVPYVKGYYTAQGRYRSDDAKTGSVIALICSTTGATYYPSEVTLNDDYTYPIENMILPVPNFEGTDPYIVQQGAGMSVIKSDNKSEYASALFMKWFTEEERNIEFSVHSGYMPVKESANDLEKIKAYNEKSGNSINETMMNTIEVAIKEINDYKLYTSVPFEKSAEVRSYIESSITDAATADYQTICNRIASGENRNDVIAEYTDDKAFEKWFLDFETNLNQLTGENS